MTAMTSAIEERAPVAIAVDSRYSVAVSDAVMRGFDVILALLAILFLLPLLVLIAMLVKGTSRGPILYRQYRIGRGGVAFPCLKFRSMVVDSETRLLALLDGNPEARREWVHNHKLKKDPRITLIGNVLRKSSLDELPQFFNVLRGEMSLVGPRPIVSEEAARYGRYIVHYCRVRPGITGLWQVSGRNNVSYRRRIALDVMYTRTCSPMLYLRILALTVPTVLAAEGSY